MTWYDFYPVVILMIIRNRMQIWYYKRGIYDYNGDVMNCIDVYCTNKFGKDITVEIKSFLPIFYDEKICRTDTIHHSNDRNKETELLIINPSDHDSD